MLRNIDDKYFNDPKIDPLNKTLSVFASYNPGQNRIGRLRKEAASMGLDPNVWLGNVELVAAKDIGQETARYVSNIYKYYVAYKLALAQKRSQAAGGRVAAQVATRCKPQRSAVTRILPSFGRWASTHHRAGST
jgi:membrane-bound lytic murein transglycosylase MltF